jgi:environmental stress-induced protein Ves
MELIIILSNLYNMYDYNINFEDLNSNKLFCTFTSFQGIDDIIHSLQNEYILLTNKIFILYVKSTNEYVCTYNLDPLSKTFPENTILVHRKKESNTLYTINALNDLIKKLNGGVVDTSYKINWVHYKNCILLTQQNELKQLNTKLHKILEI